MDNYVRDGILFLAVVVIILGAGAYLTGCSVAHAPAPKVVQTSPPKAAPKVADVPVTDEKLAPQHRPINDPTNPESWRIGEPLMPTLETDE